MAVYAAVEEDLVVGSPMPMKPSIGATRQSHIFQLLETPLSDTFALPSNHSMQVSNSRKRARPCSRGANTVAPQASITPLWSACTTGSTTLRSDALSPPPFVNTRYNLRDGFDTPTLELDSQYDGASDYREADFRRRWSVGSARQEDDTTYPRTGIRLGGERNGKRRSQPSPNGSALASPSWGSFVFGIVGGVAGKMWEICKASTFKGFHAGGGTGYEMKRAVQEKDDMQGSSIWEDMESPQSRVYSNRGASPMPGMWPEPDYFSHQADSPQQRPAKRNRTETGAGWIMVNPADNVDSSDLTPTTSARSQLSRPMARPQLRRSQPASRRSTMGVSLLGSPAVGSHQRRVPNGLSRAPSGVRASNPSTPRKDGSPASIEAQRYAEKLRREDRQTDASIKRLNERLNSMIREGKEALGTKIEIVDDMVEDEGFFQ